MSVLVKGMELPKNCAKCQFSDVFAYPPDYDDEWICELNYLSMTWEDAQMRHSNCPLVELPTPHGRLIDADALNKNLKEMSEIEWNKGVSCSWAEAFDGVTEVIDFEPTLIEAEVKHERYKI